MTDEEKKAIEELKDLHYGDYFCDVVLNLIEKQSKEIEHQIEKRANQRQELAILNEKQIEFNKLVNTVNSYKGQFKKQQKEIEELKKGFKIQEHNYQVAMEEIEQRWKDKIKAKIEIRKEEKENCKDSIEEKYLLREIYVLQSLLEKE